MIKNTPISFYIIMSVLAVIAMIFDNEWLILLTKPSIIPALLIYYFSSDKKYVSPVLLTILFVYFVSDTLALLQFQNFDIYLMIIDFIPYLLLVKVVVEDAVNLKFKKNEFILALLSFLFLMLVMFLVIGSLAASSKEFIPVLIGYGIILAIYVSMSLYIYLVTNADFAMYILIASVFGLVADIIYTITNMVFYVKALSYIEFVLQIISYFYIIAYFLKRDIEFVDLSKERI
ncbi:MAG: hypothetical protein V4670_00805 [Bacteroidota bacterium]